MARVMKIRVIPRGFTKVDGLIDYVKEVASPYSPADFFMGLYKKYGNPSNKDDLSYMLRHNNVVLRILTEDKTMLSFEVWVSSGHVQDAKRKRIKAVNVIARRLNEKNVAFVAPNDMANNLYFAVRTKNDELLKKDNDIKVSEEKMKDALSEQESLAVYGELHLFMDDAKVELKNFIMGIVND